MFKDDYQLRLKFVEMLVKILEKIASFLKEIKDRKEISPDDIEKGVANLRHQELLKDVEELFNATNRILTRTKEILKDCKK